MMRVSTYIRWGLSVLLLYGAYFETGVFTVSILTLIVLAAEVEEWGKR